MHQSYDSKDNNIIRSKDQYEKVAKLKSHDTSRDDKRESHGNQVVVEEFNPVLREVEHREGQIVSHEQAKYERDQQRREDEFGVRASQVILEKGHMEKGTYDEEMFNRAESHPQPMTRYHMDLNEPSKSPPKDAYKNAPKDSSKSPPKDASKNSSKSPPKKDHDDDIFEKAHNDPQFERSLGKDLFEES